MSIGTHGSGQNLTKAQIVAICLYALIIIATLIYGYLWH